MVEATLGVILVAIGTVTMPMTAESKPFQCPIVETIPAAMAVKTRYVQGDATFSVIDRAVEQQQAKARQAFSRPVSRINRLADLWISAPATIKPVIARCLYGQFAAQANGRAMMEASSKYDAYYREWMISTLAIAYLKAESDMDALDKQGIVRGWLRASGTDIAKFNMNEVAQGRVDNHRYWGGVAVMATGIASETPSLMETARTLRAAGLATVAQDGMLSAEARRGQLSFHYHLFAAAALSALIALDPQPVAPQEKAAMSRLSALIASDSVHLDDGVLASRTGMPQSPETHAAMAYMILPWLTDATAAARVRAMVRARPPQHQFLGGNIQWLTAQLNRSIR